MKYTFFGTRFPILFIALYATFTLSGCGGDAGDSSTPPPPPPSKPVPAITAFAGVIGGSGNVDGPLASAQFNVPAGIATDASGNFYIADSQNYTIRKISGDLVTTIAGVAGQAGSTDGPAASALFSGPQGIRVDNAGNIYVTDQGPAGNPVVRSISNAGQVTTITTGTGTALETNGSSAIAVDPTGNVYVFTSASDGASVLTRVSAGNSPTQIDLQSPTGTPVGLLNPQDIVLDSAGNLYIADTDLNGGAGIIYKVALSGGSTTGVASTLAGSTSIAGSNDGIGTTAQFDGLLNLAIDNAGNLYANDFNNGTVRAISPAGVVSTLAGTADNYGLYLGPVPGTLPDIGDLVWANGSLYLTDFDDNIVLKIGPLL